MDNSMSLNSQLTIKTNGFLYLIYLQGTSPLFTSKIRVDHTLPYLFGENIENNFNGVGDNMLNVNKVLRMH